MIYIAISSSYSCEIHLEFSNNVELNSLARNSFFEITTSSSFGAQSSHVESISKFRNIHSKSVFYCLFNEPLPKWLGKEWKFLECFFGPKSECNSSLLWPTVGKNTVLRIPYFGSSWFLCQTILQGALYNTYMVFFHISMYASWASLVKLIILKNSNKNL